MCPTWRQESDIIRVIFESEIFVISGSKYMDIHSWEAGLLTSVGSSEQGCWLRGYKLSASDVLLYGPRKGDILSVRMS